MGNAMEPRPRSVGVYEVRDRRRIVIEKPESVKQYGTEVIDL